jgi:hypothetical protein
MPRPGFTWVKLLVVIAVIVFLMCLVVPSRSNWVFEAPATLAFGWLWYLKRVIPQLNPDPGAVAIAVGCLLGVVFGSHTFLRWVYAASGSSPTACPTTDPPTTPIPSLRRWPWKWTLQLVGLVVLIFVAGVAVTGIIHQTGWLIHSPEPRLRGGMREVSARVKSTNNLKYMGLAAHDVVDNGKALPRSQFDATGRPFHSWQTALLPYLDQNALFVQIDPAKPWMHPDNAKAMGTDVKVFLHPALPPEPVHGFGVSHYAGNVRVVLSDTPRMLTDFPEGTSNTILAGEVSSHFRAWGDPLNARDPRLGATGHPEGFGGPKGKPAIIVMLDGSVRMFDPKELADLVGKIPQ